MRARTHAHTAHTYTHKCTNTHTAHTHTHARACARGHTHTHRAHTLTHHPHNASLVKVSKISPWAFKTINDPAMITSLLDAKNGHWEKFLCLVSSLYILDTFCHFSRIQRSMPVYYNYTGIPYQLWKLRASIPRLTCRPLLVPFISDTAWVTGRISPPCFVLG